MEAENVWSVGLWNTLSLLTHFHFYITFQEITFGLFLLLFLVCFSFKLKMLGVLVKKSYTWSWVKTSYKTEYKYVWFFFKKEFCF